MFRLCLLASLLGLASAQSTSHINDWYAAAASPSMATSRPATPLAPSARSSAVPSVATPRPASTMSTIASPPARSSNPASSAVGTGIKAVATLSSFNGSSVTGSVTFEQGDINSDTKISWDISGNSPSARRGIHIHEVGSTNCTAALGHYNPFNVNHGDLNRPLSHVGDLGNVNTDGSGIAKNSLSARYVKLSGQFSVIGRTFIIHGGPDDGGTTGMGNSTTTGNSGARLACGVIRLA